MRPDTGHYFRNPLHRPDDLQGNPPPMYDDWTPKWYDDALTFTTSSQARKYLDTLNTSEGDRLGSYNSYPIDDLVIVTYYKIINAFIGTERYKDKKPAKSVAYAGITFNEPLFNSYLWFKDISKNKDLMPLHIDAIGVCGIRMKDLSGDFNKWIDDTNSKNFGDVFGEDVKVMGVSKEVETFMRTSGSDNYSFLDRLNGKISFYNFRYNQPIHRVIDEIVEALDFTKIRDYCVKNDIIYEEDYPTIDYLMKQARFTLTTILFNDNAVDWQASADFLAIKDFSTNAHILRLEYNLLQTTRML